MSPFTEYLSQHKSAKAEWGLMDMHNMVEHVALTLQMSIGEHKTELLNSEEQAAKLKRIMVHSSRPMPKGIKTSMLPKDKTLPYINESFNKAIRFLELSLLKFNKTLDESPEVEHMHPTMGLLNMKEWQMLHRKHFTHHFEQFGLDVEVVKGSF